MTEMNLKQCKRCALLKIRIQDETFDGYNKRWIDENGTLWNGKVCPECHRQATREHAARKKAAATA